MYEVNIGSAEECGMFSLYSTCRCYRAHIHKLKYDNATNSSPSTTNLCCSCVFASYFFISSLCSSTIDSFSYNLTTQWKCCVCTSWVSSFFWFDDDHLSSSAWKGGVMCDISNTFRINGLVKVIKKRTSNQFAKMIYWFESDEFCFASSLVFKSFV